MSSDSLNNPSPPLSTSNADLVSIHLTRREAMVVGKILVLVEADESHLDDLKSEAVNKKQKLNIDLAFVEALEKFRKQLPELKGNDDDESDDDEDNDNSQYFNS